MNNAAGGVDVEQLARRVLLGCLQENSPQYWLRRAATFEAIGTAEGREIGNACRAKAAFMGEFSDGPDVDTFVEDLLTDCLHTAEVDGWMRRAVTFEHVGSEHADEIADACRARARFLELYGSTDELDIPQLAELTA
jgi:hypothetical protein